jgi:hypothetical protein
MFNKLTRWRVHYKNRAESSRTNPPGVAGCTIAGRSLSQSGHQEISQQTVNLSRECPENFVLLPYLAGHFFRPFSFTVCLAAQERMTQTPRPA